MTIVLSAINLKGGVGKTTIAVNFAAYCGNLGHKTLLIDLDPQTNATFASIGFKEWEKHSAAKGTVSDLLGARKHATAEGSPKEAKDVIYSDAFDNVDLIPSHLDLFTVDLDLGGEIARERKLSKALKPVREDYDIVICDCPPNLTIPTQNALAVSTHFVIPVSLDFLSAIGVGLLISRVNSLSADLDIEITNAGVILSRCGRPARHRAATEATLRKQFGDLVFKKKLTERAAVSSSAESASSVLACQDTKAVREFYAVFDELTGRIGLE